MKYNILFFFLLSSVYTTVTAQTDTASYGIVKNMPTFYEQLKRQLNYPLAWGNSPTKDYDQWRTEAGAH